MAFFTDNNSGLYLPMVICMYARRPTHIYESACMYTYAYTNMHVYAMQVSIYHIMLNHTMQVKIYRAFCF